MTRDMVDISLPSLHQSTASGGAPAAMPLAVLMALVDDPLGPSWAMDEEGSLLMRNDSASLLLGDPAAWSQLAPVAAEVASSGRALQMQVEIGGRPKRTFIVRARQVLMTDGRQAVLCHALETTVKDQLIEALRESRSMFKSLTEAMGDFAWVTDAEGRFAYVSGGVPSAGLAAWDLSGRKASDLGEEAAACFTVRAPMPQRDVWIRTPMGRTVCLSVAAVPVINGGEWAGSRGVARDVTEQRRAERLLEEARKRDRLLRQVLDSIHSGTDPAAMLENAARVTRSAFEAEVCRISYESAVVEDGKLGIRRAGSAQRLRCECRFQGVKVGRIEVERAEGPWNADDLGLLEQIAAHVAMAIAQANHLRTLETLARTDGLTGLHNRRSFEDLMAQRLGSGDRPGGVLLLIDLDHFKLLNDTGGHAAGDAALCGVADLLRRLAGPNDVVARFGGDEFVMWQEGADLAAAEATARAVMDGMEAIRQSAGGARLSASVGFAVRRSGQEPLQALMRRADGALYAVKAKGRGGFAAAEGAE